MNEGNIAPAYWLAPWRAVTSADEADGLEVELQVEVGPTHPLYGREAVAIGRSNHSDDILFYLPNHSPPLAVVHLTWLGKEEQGPHWPTTAFYTSAADWIGRCMVPDAGVVGEEDE